MTNTPTLSGLIACFAKVFPNTPKKEIPEISASTTEEWDSLHVITLIISVEMAFDVNIDMDIIASLDSFKAFKDYLGL